MSDSDLSERNSLFQGHEQWSGLSLEDNPSGLEKIFDYVQGGHHPVHLGDYLVENRYHVIHKLGNGGFANVWLCRDQHSQMETRYVAMKIMMAEASTDDSPELQVNKLKDLAFDRDAGAKHICLPLDQFKIDGPNGCHLCFVYPVLGPPVSSRILNRFEDPDRTLRKIALETVQAMNFIHSTGMCHGDYTPRNILLRIDGLNGLTEDEVICRLGEPVINKVLTDSEQHPIEPKAPKYLVYPVDWEFCPQLIRDQACIIDFGESFEASDPPADLGIPGPYRSPELILEKTAGFSSDIWALGCTLFTIRIGRKLFDLFEDEDDAYLDSMVRMLGKLPEPWWSTLWEKRKAWYADEVDCRGRIVTLKEPIQEMMAKEAPSHSDISENQERIEITYSISPWVVENARSLQDTLAPGLWYKQGVNGHPCTPIHRHISAEEIEIFADLLGKLLKLDPKERPAVRTVQNHEWLKMHTI